MKKIIKCLVFVFIFIVLFYYVFKILWLDKNPTAYFYEEPKNSLDIVYLGSSNAYEYFNPVIAYHLYGYKVGMLSASVQPFPAVEGLIKEAEKYQKPRLYVIDMARCVDTISEYTDTMIRYTTDSMKFSKNRIDIINKLLSYKDVEKKDYINNYFSFFLYHNRWKNFTDSKIKLYKGYEILLSQANISNYDEFNWKEGIIDLQKENKEVLIELINYIKLNNLNVLFVVPRKSYKEIENKRLNNAIEIINENGLDIINFNTLEDFEVDINNDFHNDSHLNVYGATKYTLYFSKYLKEHYSLEDHRNDEKYSSWEKEYEIFKSDFNSLTGKNFDDFLNANNR